MSAGNYFLIIILMSTPNICIQLFIFPFLSDWLKTGKKPFLQFIHLGIYLGLKHWIFWFMKIFLRSITNCCVSCKVCKNCWTFYIKIERMYNLHV